MTHGTVTCAELDLLLCEYVDGALDAAHTVAVEAHLEGCASCRALESDSRAVTAFIERVEDPAPPLELAARILNETASGRHGRLGATGGLRGWFGKVFAPVLQPRLVMGMALTILSFSMMARWAGISPRQLTAADMDPVKIWASLDDRTHRAWGRTVKFYEDIKFVYEIQSRLKDWSDQQEEEDRNAEARRTVEERRVTGAPRGK